MKFIYFSIILVLLISCSKPELSSVYELDKSLSSNQDSLKTYITSIMRDGLFRRNIHFASGGDSGWLDYVRDAVEADTMNLRFIDEQIVILDSLLVLNQMLINMKVNPDYFRDQNEEVGDYLDDLKEVRKYFWVMDSLRLRINSKE
ncbi:MAG: hypothetical protein JW870_16630 [Candidatus Delongbacteria bacterium]|nr:hypothetical protein [Candidatus Delongbacteria bacterium]